MGIDVYMSWKGMTEEEHRAQITGFSIEAGAAGYLRESYFASPHYATRVLVPEGFELTEEEYDAGGKPIPAATLRERLPAALEACRKRYKGDPFAEEACKSHQAFVELAERKERETGEPCRVRVSW